MTKGTGRSSARGGARLLTIGTMLALGTALIGGCADKGDGDHAGHDSLPAGSSAAEAKGKGGDHSHANLADELAAHTHTTKLEFTTEPKELPVGTPAIWTLRIVDSAGNPVKDFDVVHDKLMHLIIVSRDLTWFNHIHPEYKGDGVFTVQALLPRAGHYRLFADYTPKGAHQEVAPYDFATAGAPAAASAALVADSLGDSPWIVKQTISRPEGEPEATGGTAYQVALMPMPGKIAAGQDVMLHFQVRDKSGKPLAALEPYLGAMGHAVILSSDAKIYLHTHPMDGEGHEGMDHGSHGAAPATSGGAAGAGVSGAGAASTIGDEGDAKKKPSSDVIFHTNFPTPGLYKVWGQFQHKGRIITAAYVLNVVAAS